MDILLHVGMPKAGSTAIQRRLAGLRGWLAAQGLYYPEGLHTPHNHSFLVAAASRRRLLPPHYRRHYGQNTDRAAEIAGFAHLAGRQLFGGGLGAGYAAADQCQPDRRR